MQYTTEQIAVWVKSMDGSRTVANGIFRDAFELAAPAIVAQQTDRIKELETVIQNTIDVLSFAHAPIDIELLLKQLEAALESGDA